MTLTHDFHTHLYGVLTAEDIYQLGKERYELYRDRLLWYETEYKKATGIIVDSNAYWQKPSGFDLLRRDVTMIDPGTFPTFQAKFNLLIALFPINALETTVLEHVIRQDAARGLSFVEYRVPLPPHLPAATLTEVARRYCQTGAALNREYAGSFQCRLAFSLARDPAPFAFQWEALCQGVSAEDPMLSGIDFCGSEDGFPPTLSAPCLATIKRERPHLQILMHVGEQFTHLTHGSAIRWIDQAASLGADRLGHATALGVKGEHLLSPLSKQEPVQERLAHLTWLLTEDRSLQEFGFSINQDHVKNEIAEVSLLPSHAVVTVNEGLDETENLRGAVLRRLKARGTIIETCPTSNRRIAGIAQAQHLPCRTFAEFGVRLVVGRDDPGLFETDAATEWSDLEASIGSVNLAGVRETVDRLKNVYGLD